MFGRLFPPVVGLSSLSATISEFSRSLALRLVARRLARRNAVRTASHSSPPSLSFKLTVDNRSKSCRILDSLF